MPLQKTAAKKTPKSTSTTAGRVWNWADQLPVVLQTMSRVLKIRTDRIWTTSVEREAFVEYVQPTSFAVKARVEGDDVTDICVVGAI